MKFRIEKEVFDRFPNLIVAIPVILGFDNTKSQTESLEFLREQEEELKKKFTIESFFKDENVTSYLDAFKKFGIDPEKRLPAHVALSKRVLEGGELPDINPMVNLYNAMSIKYTTPFGGEDLSSLYGDFVLKFADGTEKWIPIGGKKSNPVVKGDLVWGDGLDVSTPSLNWLQCERTKLTKESKDGYFIMDGFSDVNREVIENAAKEFVELATKLFGGQAEMYWLSKDSPEAKVAYETKDIKSVKKEPHFAKASRGKQGKGEKEQGESIKKNYIGVAKVIAEAIKKVTGIEEVHLEVPENQEFGDYSTNVAMQLAGKKREVKGKSNKFLQDPLNSFKSPRTLAEEIKDKLTQLTELNKLFEKIEIAGPGFINFFLKKEILYDTLDHITKRIDIYVKTGLFNDKKISVEYTDPNPFKEFHIGHLYSNIIGESIATILEANGATVWRADFYGDVGMHVAKSVWGIMQKMEADKMSLGDLEKLTVKERQKFMGQGYAYGVNKYEEDDAVKEQIKNINYMAYVASQEIREEEKGWKPLIDYKKYIEGNIDHYKNVKSVYRAGLSWSLEYFETYYRRLGTKFNGYYPESWVGEYGVQMVEKGLKKGILEKSDGAIVFKGEKYGLHTRVFLNKMGLPTYEAKDLGLAKAKYEDFKYDRSINIFGKEIDEYYFVVKKAMELIEPELGSKASHIAHGMVNLPEGKMSSRSGNVITVEWLLNEAKSRVLPLIDNDGMEDKEKDGVAEIVGQGAIKYALLKSSIGNNITFDFNESIKFEGNSGPYLQYTYARTQSVLTKSPISNYQSPINSKLVNSQIENSKTDWQLENGDWKLNKEELVILRTLIHYPEIIAEAAEKYAPNLICNYLYDLAQKFNTFYNKHRILESESLKDLPAGKARRESKSSTFKGSTLQGGHSQKPDSSTDPTSNFRLSITSATGQVLKNGLHLLGIKVPARM